MYNKKGAFVWFCATGENEYAFLLGFFFLETCALYLGMGSDT